MGEDEGHFTLFQLSLQMKFDKGLYKEYRNSSIGRALDFNLNVVGSIPTYKKPSL